MRDLHNTANNDIRSRKEKLDCIDTFIRMHFSANFEKSFENSGEQGSPVKIK